MFTFVFIYAYLSLTVYLCLFCVYYVFIMESPNFEFGHGQNSDSKSDDSQHSPPMVHGINSVGETAFNTVGLGPPGLSSTSTQRVRNAKRDHTS